MAFLVCGGLGMLLSEHFLFVLVRDQSTLMTIQHYKSGAFLVAGTLLVHLLVTLDARERERAAQRLQQAHEELMAAYDQSIEGWSHALDLRDRETAGHSRRVTAMTLRVARAMGLSHEALVHIRRGALLHDIGKMGVPDSVLLKPGPLTDDERLIMQRHPLYARECLASLAFLQPALDIPCCHHERCDGTGYPQGLKGEQIPLAARIFAVVDVWDALRSDRPYRAGWPEAKIREHLRQHAGTHFDPHVVDVFLNNRR